MTRKSPAAKRLSPAAIAKYFEAKLQAEWGPYDVKRHREADPSQVIVLDVRDKASYNEEHIEGAINIPLEELPRRAKELSKSKDIVTYCWTITCSLAPKAALRLAQKGYKVHELTGGIATWKEYNMPVTKSSPANLGREVALTN
jgi:rhodanese-related sulfurtransferase